MATLMFSYAVEETLGVHATSVLKSVQIVQAIVLLAILAPVLTWKLTKLDKLDQKERREYFANDSYMVRAYLRARTISWAATIFTLFVMARISRALVDLPPEFYLHLGPPAGADDSWSDARGAECGPRAHAWLPRSRGRTRVEQPRPHSAPSSSRCAVGTWDGAGYGHEE